MNWDKLVKQWQETLDANARLGGDSSELIIEGPASESEIKALESELELSLPRSLRDSLLTFSKHVEFSWFLPERFSLPESLRQIFGCVFGWSLDDIAEAELGRRARVEAIEELGADPAGVWKGSVGFHDIINGDCLAIDLARLGQEPVVYLVHDDDDMQGAKMGQNFQDFLVRWSSLGCPGPEWWQWALFTENEQSYIDPNCANALLWKKTLGLES